MKGNNIVLLASTQEFLKCPAHSDLRSSLNIRAADVACITHDDSASSDADWSQSDNAESSSEASSEASGKSSDFRSPVSAVRMSINMRSTSGSSPLLSGVTLQAVEAAWTNDAFDSELASSGSEVCSSDSEDENFDNAEIMQSVGLHDLLTLDDLRSVVCDIIPYCKKNMLICIMTFWN
jgi:hypothetical protein